MDRQHTTRDWALGLGVALGVFLVGYKFWRAACCAEEERAEREKWVDATVADSFPASDPPSFTPGRSIRIS